MISFHTKSISGSNLTPLHPLKWPHEPFGEIEVVQISYSTIYQAGSKGVK